MALKNLLGMVVGGKPVALELDLARGVLIARPHNLIQAVQLINSPTLDGLRRHITQAAHDDRVAGLIVHAACPPMGLAYVEEIGQLVEEFGSAKPTVAWAESFGELTHGLPSYRIACAAQHIWVQPTGMLSIGGVEAQITLFKGMLDKAGIKPQFGQRHEYKTAANTFAADHVTDPHREMIARLGESTVESLVADIARLRGIPTDRIWEAIDASPLEASQALEIGLVDRLGYRDEVYDTVLGQWGLEPGHLLYAQRYTSKAALARRLRPHQPKIAMVTLRGAIVTGRGARNTVGQEHIGADVVDEHLRVALRDDAVKAVVLEVDSPGGSAVASDAIRRCVLRLRQAGKPVVACMGAVAASGGYYVSMGADEIVAQATTLTGSIGVVAGKMVTSGLYDKLGLVRESLPTGRAAAMFSSAREFTDEEWDRINAWLDRVYRDFTTFAAHDRDMDYDELEQLARGRVWTGADAHRHGLVDHLGGHGVAVDRACRLAGLRTGEVKLVHVGDDGVLTLLKPAQSSETSAGGALIPNGEAMLSALAQQAGLSARGVLSIPWDITIE